MDPRSLLSAQQPLLPHWFPPPGAYVQDVIAGFNTTPGAGFQTAFDFTVPQDRRCMVGWLGIESNDPSTAATVTWRFLIDSSAHYNYNAPPMFIGTVDDPSRIWIELSQQRHVELQFNDTSLLAGHAVFFRLGYWFWNEQVYARPSGAPEILPEDAT